MAQIPNTDKKLREAKFFLDHMSKVARSPLGGDFDFYLSAFLSAGRSVPEFLAHEQKYSPTYFAWYAKWKQALSRDEIKLLDFTNKQRVAGVHKKGAEIQGDVEISPLTLVDPDYRRDNIAWVNSGWFDSPGAPPPEMELMVRYFKIEGKKKKVVDICKRYLALLGKLIEEFQKAFP